MKKYFVILTALMLSFGADAFAGGFGGVGTGINFGYLHSAYRTLDWATDELVEKNGMNGLYVGVNHDATLIPGAAYFQTGFYYSYLNESRRESLPFLPNKLIGDRSEHYINVPVRVKYVVPVAHWLDVFAYAGPTFVAGLSSTLTYRTRLSEDKTAAVEYDYFSSKIKDKNIDEGVAEWFASQLPDTRYRRLDVLLGGAVGALFVDVIEAHIGYDRGLINRNGGEFGDDFKTNRHQFYISVGVRF